MKSKKILAYIILFLTCSIIIGSIYRVYYTYHLNISLEMFIAEQIKPVQDKIYEEKGVNNANEYFIRRGQRIRFNIGKAIVKADYSSYWIFRDEHPEQLPLDNYLKEERKNYGETYEWFYSIQPMSNSKVCIRLYGFPPSSWKAEDTESTWTVDVSQNDWRLLPFNLPCEKSKNTLHTFLLFFH